MNRKHISTLTRQPDERAAEPVQAQKDDLLGSIGSLLVAFQAKLIFSGNQRISEHEVDL